MNQPTPLHALGAYNTPGPEVVNKATRENRKSFPRETYNWANLNLFAGTVDARTRATV